MDQHQILADLVKHSYQMMDEGTKVRHLTQGIKKYALNVIKANILATPEIQRDFDIYVSLFKSYIASNWASKELNLNISESNTDSAPGNNKNRPERGGGQGRGRSIGSHGAHGGGNCGGNKPKQNHHGKRKCDENDSDGSDVSYCYHTLAEYATLSTKKRNQIRKYRESEEKKSRKTMKATQIQISLLKSNIESSNKSRKSPKQTNVKNPALNGVRRRITAFVDTYSE